MDRDLNPDRRIVAQQAEIARLRAEVETLNSECVRLTFAGDPKLVAEVEALRRVRDAAAQAEIEWRYGWLPERMKPLMDNLRAALDDAAKEK